VHCSCNKFIRHNIIVFVCLCVCICACVCMCIYICENVVGAMSQQDPLELGSPGNEEIVKYFTDIVAKPDFSEYTPVS